MGQLQIGNFSFSQDIYFRLRENVVPEIKNGAKNFISHFGAFKDRIEIWSTHIISSVRNMRLSVGKLQLPAHPNFFDPRRR